VYTGRHINTQQNETIWACLKIRNRESQRRSLTEHKRKTGTTGQKRCQTEGRKKEYGTRGGMKRKNV
jgi:hypothetical protein